MYQAGTENRNADALFGVLLEINLHADVVLDDTQVAAIQTTKINGRKLLAVGPNCVIELDEIPTEQQKDPNVQEIRGPKGLPLKIHHL